MRIRLRYTCTGKVRFLSHRDVARVWERTLRRVGLPVAYSEGFSPRPRLHFGLALSVGHESLAEYLEVDLATGVDLVTGASARVDLAAGAGARVDLAAGDGAGLDPAVGVDGGVAVVRADGAPSASPTSSATSTVTFGLLERLTDLLPAGIECVAAGVVAPGSPSLQEAVTSCTWQIDVEGLPEAGVREAVARALAADELPLERERKGKLRTDDLRPALLACAVERKITDPRSAPAVRLRVDLATQPRGVRPRELVAVLHPALREQRVVRLHQWTTPDGAAREEPLAGEAPRARHAEVRAS